MNETTSLRYIVYNIETTEVLRVNTRYANMTKSATYKAKGPATVACRKANEKAGKIAFAVCTSEEWTSISSDYDEDGNIKMVERVNLLTGKPFMEPINTPSYCSPASERYWTM